MQTLDLRDWPYTTLADYYDSLPCGLDPEIDAAWPPAASDPEHVASQLRVRGQLLPLHREPEPAPLAVLKIAIVNYMIRKLDTLDETTCASGERAYPELGAAAHY